MVSKLKWVASVICIILYHVTVFYLTYKFQNQYTVAACVTTLAFHVWYTAHMLNKLKKEILELQGTNIKTIDRLLNVIKSAQNTVIFCNSLKTKKDNLFRKKRKRCHHKNQKTSLNQELYLTI